MKKTITPKIGLITIFIVLLAVLTGMCFLTIKSIKANAKEEQSSSIDHLDKIGSSNIYDYVDEDTGVHYLVFQNIKGSAMSVRYNDDGSIMTDKR